MVWSVRPLLALSSEGLKPISASFYKNGGIEAPFLILSVSARSVSNTQENVFFWGSYCTSSKNLTMVCVRHYPYDFVF